MKLYWFLDLDEPIKATDEVRDTYLHYGWGDAPYNGDKIRWGPAKERIPGWVGKTLRQYLAFGDRKKKASDLDIEVRRPADKHAALPA